MIAIAVTAPGVAWAGDVALGASLGVSYDLPDRVSGGQTRFGPGPTLSIPVRYRLAEGAFLKATVRADVGSGTDRVSWAGDLAGDPVRLATHGHWGLLTAASFTIGGEARVPDLLPVEPLFGVELGGAWVGTWHSFGPPDGEGTDTTFLLDPAQNDLQDPNNRDPYATAWTAVADVRLGTAVPVSEPVEVVIEIGYTLAYLKDAPLQKSPPALDARRDAFGWNTIRLQAGVSWSF